MAERFRPIYPTMKRPLSLLAALAAASTFATACGFEPSGNVVAPSAIGNDFGTGASVTPAPIPPTPVPAVPVAPAYLGEWASIQRTSARSVAFPTLSSCADFRVQVTSQTSTAVAGNFSALCPGNVSLSGSLSGQLGGPAIPILFSGTGTAPGLPSCSFSLNGTATISGDTITVPYTGTTCLGPVSGTEVLRRPAPTAPPAPTPTPPPPPSPADPILGCGGLVADKLALVTCIHDRLNPPHTAAGAFEITKRVAWALRGEGAGLLIKNGGENIVSWRGYSFSASRICAPDGHIYKVLSDVPTTNGASWQDNDFVDPRLYVPAIDPTL